MKNVLGIIAIVAAIAVLGYWYSDGAHVYNVDTVKVEKVDPLFGTKYTEWVADPHIGLLPAIGPVAGGLFVVGCVLLILGARDRAKAKAAMAGSIQDA
ncbi:MAG TPA: hypothetical protein VHI13_14085 [Candidatus Kapabacteria bacterium]|nr:hypothetical protein [Candidatus Kapabacteria bacterium]